MTLFEKMCSLLLALEHDLRTPVGILKGDLGCLKTEGGFVERMERQVEKILGVIPPVERIMTEVIQGRILADGTQGNVGSSWFVEQVRSLGSALDGRTVQFSLIGTELQILFEPGSSSENYSALAGREFSTFCELFRALESNYPSYIIMADMIVDHLGWSLSLRIQ